MASRKQQQKKLQRQARRKQEKIAQQKSQEPGSESELVEVQEPVEPQADLGSSSDGEEIEPAAQSSDVGDNITFIPANDMRKNTYVLLRKDKYPCKIMEMHKSKTGKHGGAKIRVVGLDLFTGKKYDDIFLSKAQVEIPIVKKIKSHLIRVDGNSVWLRAIGGNARDAKAASVSAVVASAGEEKKMILEPEDNPLHAKLLEKYRDTANARRGDYNQGLPLIVTVVEAMGNEAIADVRAP